MSMPDISYEYYYNTFCCGREGVIPADDFSYFMQRASEEVNLRICSEISPDCTHAVCNTVCEVAEFLYSSLRTGIAKSESIDGYSITYPDPAVLFSRISNIIEKHLAKSGLLYRGV